MKKNMILIFISLLVLVLASLFIANQNNVFSVAGLQVLSLSSVNFESNDQSVGGEAFLLRIANTGAGQWVTGKIDSEDITDDGKQATKDLKIDLVSKGQYCDYSITAQVATLKTARIIDSGSKFWISESVMLNSAEAKSCSSKQGSWIAKEKGVLNIIEYWCIVEPYKGTLGAINTAKLVSESDIIVNIDGTNYQAEMSNDGTTSASLANGKIHASFTGFLGTGENCPSASDAKVTTIYANTVLGKNWHITDLQDWNDYRTFEQTGFNSCLANFVNGISFNTPEWCVSKYNGLSAVALEGKIFETQGGSSAQSSGTSSNGRITIPLNRRIGYDTFILRVKASMLGVFIPVGQPNINNIVCNDFKSGNDGNVFVSIENEGSVSAGFNIKTSCTGNIAVTSTTQRETFGAGDIKTINIPITAQGKGNDKCTVIVSDNENPTVKDSAIVTCSYTDVDSNLCTEGEKVCEGNLQFLCTGGELKPTGDASCENVVPPPNTLWIKIVAMVILLGLGIFSSIRAKKNPFWWFGIVISFSLLFWIFFTFFTIWIAILFGLAIISGAIGLLLSRQGLPEIGVWFFLGAILFFIIGIIIFFINGKSFVSVLTGGVL